MLRIAGGTSLTCAGRTRRDLLRAGGEVPGQTGGFAGQRYDPFDIPDDPSQPNFRVQDIAASAELPGIGICRGEVVSGLLA
ncbi:MAG: hypothetical protein ACK47B_03915 [Armatimonadota bacterium]